MAKARARQLEELVAAARQDPDVLAVLLFGSTAREQEGPLSDVDICLVLVPGKGRLDQATLTLKRLEYLRRFDLDVQVFQQLPLYIRRRVLREGEVVLAKDADRLYDIAFRTAQAFEDFKHIYDDYLEQVARAGP